MTDATPTIKVVFERIIETRPALSRTVTVLRLLWGFLRWVWTHFDNVMKKATQIYYEFMVQLGIAIGHTILIGALIYFALKLFSKPH